MPRAKEAGTQKPSHASAKTPYRPSMPRRKVIIPDRVKEEDIILLVLSLEPELQEILDKHDKPEPLQHPTRRPKPRLLIKSNRTTTKRSLPNNTGGVEKPSTETKMCSKGKEAGEAKRKAADMRLRSASRPRRSPWKHGTAVV
jgi:hypothetical protein